MTLNQWAEAVHKNAVEHGWWEQERSALEIHALIHTEVSEATEAVKDDKPAIWVDFTSDEFPKKPEGEAVELADCMIRIMDYFEQRGWDLEHVINLKHEYNKTRPLRHGGKKF